MFQFILRDSWVSNVTLTLTPWCCKMQMRLAVSNRKDIQFIFISSESGANKEKLVSFLAMLSLCKTIQLLLGFDLIYRFTR